MEVHFIVENVRGRPLEGRGGLSGVYTHAEVHFVEMRYGGPLNIRINQVVRITYVKVCNPLIGGGRLGRVQIDVKFSAMRSPWTHLKLIWRSSKVR